MKTVLRTAPFKCIIALLASLVLLATAALTTVTVLLEANGVYKESYRTSAERRLGYTAESYTMMAFFDYLDGDSPVTQEGFVYCFIEDGTSPSSVLIDTGINGAENPVLLYYVTQIGAEQGRIVYPNEYREENWPLTVYRVYRIYGGFRSDSAAMQEVRTAQAGLEAIRSWRYVLPALTGVGVLLTLVLGFFLCKSAGRRKNTEQPVLNRADKIPLDLALAGLTGIGIGLIALLYQIVYEFDSVDLISVTPLVFIGILGEIASLLLTWLIYTVAARIKAGTVIKNTVIYRILSSLFRGIKALIAILWKLIRRIPAVPGTAAVMGFLAFCNIFLGILSKDAAVCVLLFLEWTALFVAALLISLGFSYLQKKTKAMAKGDLRETIDTRYLAGPLKEEGEDLNRIGEGLNAAVNERMKSERMKTELITNVSHDIKTPLTSIVNYTDLLSKEALPEQAAQYVEVLQRQSARLKKLTEDLVEASKASSGALSVEFAPCDLKVLLNQTVGEYEEKTAEQELTVLLSLPQEPVIISADGRRLWRIFENLMNNICKYALPSTRVYLDLKQEEGWAVITFRNISRDPLNINPEELTERFVRGDRSRSTEGSGLGLAIARSLTELQKGTLRVETDGDLFKVTAAFPLQNDATPE